MNEGKLIHGYGSGRGCEFQKGALPEILTALLYHQSCH